MFEIGVSRVMGFRFWWRYFRGEAIHPQRELNDNLKKLVTFDDVRKSFLFVYEKDTNWCSCL